MRADKPKRQRVPVHRLSQPARRIGWFTATFWRGAVILPLIQPDGRFGQVQFETSILDLFGTRIEAIASDLPLKWWRSLTAFEEDEHVYRRGKA